MENEVSSKICKSIWDKYLSLLDYDSQCKITNDLIELREAKQIELQNKQKQQDK